VVEGVILGFAIASLIGAVLGKSLKDRAGEGALLGLLFGPVGWLAVCLISDNKRLCPECQERVAITARICKHCRFRLPPPPSPEAMGFLPIALRVGGVCGLFATAIAVLAYISRPVPSDNGTLIVGASGVALSALVYAGGILVAQLQRRKNHK